MDQLTQVRPLELIEAEINFYKQQTANGIIEIGKRLIEAKEQVQHGEWGKWLEEKADFSQDTANNFMKIAREFSNSEALRNLPYKKLFLLSTVPADQREEFVAENNLEEMTTRQIEAAVKEYKTKLDEANNRIKFALEGSEKAEKKAKEAEMRLEAQRNSTKEKEKQLADLKQQLAQAKSSGNADKSKELLSQISAKEQEIENYQAEIGRLNQKLQELNKQLKDKPIETAAVKTVEVIPEETQRELDELRRNAVQPGSSATLKYKIYFEDLKEDFKKLLAALEEIKAEDPGSYQKYRKATASLVEIIGNKVYDAVVEDAKQEATPAAEFDCNKNCGICKHANMDGVTDEELDDNKTRCTLTEEVVDFEHNCSRFEDMRN